MMNHWRFSARSKPINRVVSLPSSTINFARGSACPQHLPGISHAANLAAQEYRHETMQYSSLYDLTWLRKEIASRAVREGIDYPTENILIVNGAKQGLDLICRVFLYPGDSSIVTVPTYMTVLAIFRTFEVDCLAISQDDEGLKTDELEVVPKQRQNQDLSMPKFLFDIPDFHNPTGIMTSLHRWRQLLTLAKSYHFMLVEDDSYHNIRFKGEDVLPIKSLDGAGIVVNLGTGSKIPAPGLRMGCAIADRKIIARMAAQKSDGGSGAYIQRIFVELLKNGRVDQHIGNTTVTLQHHRDAILDTLT